MRFTFIVAGWPESVHDMRVFNDSIQKYGDKFSHPSLGIDKINCSFYSIVARLSMPLTTRFSCVGKFCLVNSGYPNLLGYLAPYKGTKYHIPEFRQDLMPRGKNELVNYAHSSLRNVIERSFRVLKMEWRILLDLPSLPMPKQRKIIVACMALHNFICESALADTTSTCVIVMMITFQWPKLRLLKEMELIPVMATKMEP
jgi:hypothetical protein